MFDDSQVWVMFFSGLVSIQYHPRNEQGPDLNGCAALADLMMAHYKERFK